MVRHAPSPSLVHTCSGLCPMQYCYGGRALFHSLSQKVTVSVLLSSLVFPSPPLSSPLLPPVRCKQQVDAYIAAKREDAHLSVGGDLRKINHCFKLLKVSCVYVCTCVHVQESVFLQHDNHEYLVLRPCWVSVVYSLVTGESTGAIEGPSAEPNSGVCCAHITCL